ncbi:hypothetical protein EIP86_004016 [Pleurotus ostreatoroseus]|nr:hypothetical protein EIP86_004016 [Pleurotus ostreatoroseus]
MGEEGYRSAHAETLDDDELFAQLEAELEDDQSTAYERDDGVQEMMKYMERRKQLADAGHGQYTTLKDDAEVLDITISQKLSKKYFSTRFVRVLAEKAPFLVDKLGVKVLPCVICFKKSMTCGRVVGFEELGNRDDFATSTLESKLIQFGVVRDEEEFMPSVTYSAKPVVRQHIRGQNSTTPDEDFDFDL